MLTGKLELLLSNSQFGFRKNRSTTDAILTFQHFVLSGFRACEDAGRATNVIAVFFDIAKAFDSVPFDKIISCLQNKFHLSSSWLHFLDSYLTGRSMRIRVGQVLSEASRIVSGVPQGSILGPTLFTAFINQVVETEIHSKSGIIMYADDIAYIHAIDSEDSESIIQEDINLLSDRISSIGLKLNARKCQYMVIGLGNQRSRSQVWLSVGNNDLEMVLVYK